MTDPFNLQRFADAQAGVVDEVLAELRAGQKRSHWIWFIFPQMKGLGSSAQANFYGIGSFDEASAYMRHPILGPRLVQCTELVNQVKDRTHPRDSGLARRLEVLLFDDSVCTRCRG